MMKTTPKKHVPLPKDTPAYFCGNCGAVSLDPKNICNPQGKLRKMDHENFKIMTNGSNESSLPGLYVVGALKTGHSQAIIAAGQGR